MNGDTDRCPSHGKTEDCPKCGRTCAAVLHVATEDSCKVQTVFERRDSAGQSCREHLHYMCACGWDFISTTVEQDKNAAAKATTAPTGGGPFGTL